jgi:hypothetical protein
MYGNFNSKCNDSIRSHFPAFTGHGTKHINQILKLLGQLFGEEYEVAKMGNDIARIDKICDDLFVLSAATIWHDSAMAKGKREGHAETLRKDMGIRQWISDSLTGMGLEDETTLKKIVSLICRVAAAHSDEESLSDCIHERIIMVDDRYLIVRERALAAMLRLCDELSDDYTRITPNYTPDSDSEIYWNHSASVASVRINKDVVCIEYRISPEAIENHRLYRVKTINLMTGKIEWKQVSLLNYILFRIDKVHSEMNVCCPLFSEFALINELEVKLYPKEDVTDDAEPFAVIKMRNKTLPTKNFRPILSENMSDYESYKSVTEDIWNSVMKNFVIDMTDDSTNVLEGSII